MGILWRYPIPFYAIVKKSTEINLVAQKLTWLKCELYSRQVKKYQSGNQKPYIEGGQITQWTEGGKNKNKQW